MSRASAYQRLRMERDAHPCDIQHGEVICAVAYSHYLVERDVFFSRNERQELGFLFAVHNFSGDSARDHSVGDLQFIGENVINSQQLLQMFAEECKSA